MVSINWQNMFLLFLVFLVERRCFFKTLLSDFQMVSEGSKTNSKVILFCFRETVLQFPKLILICQVKCYKCFFCVKVQYIQRFRLRVSELFLESKVKTKVFCFCGIPFRNLKSKPQKYTKNILSCFGGMWIVSRPYLNPPKQY